MKTAYELINEGLKQEGFKVLADDPVYLNFMNELEPGGVLVGGKIEEKTNCLPTEARKLIHVAVLNTEDGMVMRYTFNYNKLLREQTQ